MLTFICQECGKERKTKEATLCHSCASKKRIKFHPQNGKNNPNWKGGHNNCEDCGKELSNRYVKKCRTHCRTGKLNHFYKHGQGNFPYPLEFSDKLKENIRKRDDYLCQECGITEEEHLIVWGEILSVHHIDYNKFNNVTENLLTLCRNCNTRANFNVACWQEKFRNRVDARKT